MNHRKPLPAAHADDDLAGSTARGSPLPAPPSSSHRDFRQRPAAGPRAVSLPARQTPARAAGSEQPEKTAAKAGFIALTDGAAPAVAAGMGLCKKHHVKIGLPKAPPRAALRDTPGGGEPGAAHALRGPVCGMQAGSRAVMVTHDVDEAVLLSDRIVMMTDGPVATVGGILRFDLPKRRERLRRTNDARPHQLRTPVLQLPYERHAHPQAA